MDGDGVFELSVFFNFQLNIECFFDPTITYLYEHKPLAYSIRAN